MVRVGLIADEISVEKGTGIAKYTRNLHFHLEHEGTDVRLIHASSPKTIFGPPINHCFKLPYQVIAHMKECDLLHAVTTITGLCFPIIRKPKIITCHDLISLVYPRSGFHLHVKFFAPLFLRVNRFCDKVITVSTLTKKDLMKYLGIKEEKIVVIPQGVDEKLKPLRKKREGQYTIGYLGTLILRKRVDYLVKAFWRFRRKYPQVRAKLLIYGGKRFEYHSLVKLVEELGLSKDVEFKGFIQDPVNAYNLFDVFVFPSEYEGFGLPILEAQRCGIPIVTRSDSHLPPEVVKHTVKAKSHEDMADKIYELLTNESLREEVINRGLEYSKQFNWENTSEKTIEVYEEVMKRT